MIKRVLAVLIALFVAFIPVTASAVGIATAIGSALVVVGAINDVYSFSQLIDEAWSPIADSLAKQAEIKRQQLLAYWNEIILQGKLSETNFREYYSHIIEVSGNVAYFTPPVSDEQMYIVNAYAAVLDTSANGLSLDDICAYCFSNGTATDNPDTGFDADGNVTVSGKTFSEICKQLEDQYAPDVSNSYISWQTEKHSKATYQLTFYQYGEGLPTGTAECYLVPFYRDGDKYYFSKYEYCFMIVDGVLKCSYKDILDNPDGEFTEDSNINISLAEYPYVQLCCMPSYQNYNLFMPFTHEYKVYSDFVGMSNIHATTGKLINANCGDYYASTDITSVVGILDVSSKFMSKPTGEEDYDLGFVIDSEYMSFDGWVQPIPVADDDLITLTGDTIYDYSITNTEGDTTTINNYITNNYVIPETPDDGSDNGSNGSSGSGDVSVSGKIDVGGSVDINVNVSSGSGEGVQFDQDVSLENYYEWMNEETAGFSEFMGGFLSWLPAPIVTLLCCGFGAVVLMRFIGR